MILCFLSIITEYSFVHYFAYDLILIMFLFRLFSVVMTEMVHKVESGQSIEDFFPD